MHPFDDDFYQQAIRRHTRRVWTAALIGGVVYAAWLLLATIRGC